MLNGDSPVDPDARAGMYMTPPQVAALLHTSVSHLANLRSRRERFPFVKIGGRVLYRRQDVELALNESLVMPRDNGGRQ